MVLASQLIEELTKLIEEHGDHLVMVCDIDDRSPIDLEPPKFGYDGFGEECFLV